MAMNDCHGRDKYSAGSGKFISCHNYNTNPQPKADNDGKLMF